MTESAIFQPLALPNGSTVSNRLCKAAMEENLAEQPGQYPGTSLFALYDAWAKGGVGMILTGNVMVAPSSLTGPGGVVLEKGTDLAPFKRWADIGKSGSAQMWMQINHTGRQMYKNLGEEAVSPSDKALDLGKLSSLFAEPRALQESEIEAIIQRFVDTALQAEAAGFDGVQIHSAHGYLSSQFLSPLTNQRTDQWGGSLENRARFLLSIVERVRKAVKLSFGVAVKLNSADFQKGGFEFEEARQVVEWLNGHGVDFVELSGGSYESPAMTGSETGAEPDNSTGKREAYFIQFARDIAKVADMPIMVTGGITKRSTAEDAMQNDAVGFGVEMLGIARAMAFNPNLPNDWKEGRSLEFEMPSPNWSNTSLKGLATMAITKAQMGRMAAGKPVNPNISPIRAMLADQWHTARRAKNYRKWRAGKA
ncbi:NADH:flavin oxidoreductase/NADH oxidase family protein [Pontixanthobacter aestiaquae]|uniref:2,4-dienoyl-CoA reductase n=1 Tax=Pontixanthobacter aestiaquae TaxID=1509367 RepID=A0A844Z4R0_9SPHN|nr:NADH:flavin oxidoreductase/NADH oxidase family protein [Pontixanthobacter aestiaquae]MDN3646685.1 NADH:flavin oxidoreductase/NADH oxidase family protein [Pontixanthobacter aestiaquae]MXO82332.1 2,4-dienoyl-CoA reductase [Pontixanthobacter aestiaquae]